jgi:hypothetical protein
MRYSQFLIGAMAVAFGAQGVVGVSHGELTDYNGKKVRWHELAEGIFTGVPDQDWDEKGKKNNAYIINNSNRR